LGSSSPNDGLQIHDPAPEAAIADLAGTKTAHRSGTAVRLFEFRTTIAAAADIASVDARRPGAQLGWWLDRGAGGLERCERNSEAPASENVFAIAQRGFEELLTKHLLGYPFRFYLVGILASLRAVHHALMNHDSKLSEEHKRVVGKWLLATPPLSTPELRFIETSRNLILKGGSFPGYATVTESSTGEEPNLEITETSYELAYYQAGERHDLEKAIRRAIDWCDRELTAIEAELPPAYDPQSE